MVNNIGPSKECLERISKFRSFIKEKNKIIDEARNTAKEALLLVQSSKEEARVAVERQKAAEVTLSQAIQNYTTDGDSSEGREEDFSYRFKSN